MFFFLEKDSFEKKSSEKYGEQSSTSQRKFKEDAPIRRPYRGIQIKDDTYAVLSVRKPSGEAIPLSSSSARDAAAAKYGGGVGLVNEYSDFILQQVQDQRMEKQQIVETFGDAFVYFFGERPRIVTFSGQLMNTEDFNWRAQFWHNYEKHLRGSRLVQANARCYLAYDTIVIEGYPLSATAVDDADNPYQVSFQMTMLMTDYHEYTSVGSMVFPSAAGATSLDVLNQELEEHRSKFLSSTITVRAFNLSGSTNNQIPRTNSALAALRSGISVWNSAATWLGDQLQTVNNLLGGRAMRVPIGAASFLQLSQEGELAVGSANVVTTASTAFDAATGERFGTVTVNGQKIPGNKLQIMGPAKYAPSWTSAVFENQSRGMIYENVDEYPLRDNPKSTLQDLLLPSQYEEVMSRARIRTEKMSAFQESLALYNVFVAQGSLLGTIAEVVSAVRQGYGMLLTAANVIRDPLGTVTGALGVTPQDVTRIGEGLKSGALIPGVNMFVGGAAQKTWEGWLVTVGEAKIGDVFNGFEYDPKAGFDRTSSSKKAIEEGNKNYDLAYGDADYTPLITSRRTAEEEAIIAGGLAAETSTADRIEQTLDEVYGNTDSAAFGGSSESPSTLDEVYGQEGTIQKTTPMAEERARLLAQAQAADAAAEAAATDTSGITAVDADSAPIDPVV